MAVSRGWRRLLRIRELEQEQSRVALESSVSELRRLERADAAACQRNQGGRRLVNASVRSGVLDDRIAGLEETRAGERFARALAPRIEAAAQDVETLREDFLTRRMERRQVETLIEEAEVVDAQQAERRAQQAIDDWFRNRKHGQELAKSRRDETARVGREKTEPGRGGVSNGF
jgi:hypothetical protein